MAKERKEKTTRELLINAIDEFGGDELEKDDWVRMAKLDEKQLVEQIISILNYYHEQSNS